MSKHYLPGGKIRDKTWHKFVHLAFDRNMEQVARLVTNYVAIVHVPPLNELSFLNHRSAFRDPYQTEPSLISQNLESGGWVRARMMV